MANRTNSRVLASANASLQTNQWGHAFISHPKVMAHCMVPEKLRSGKGLEVNISKSSSADGSVRVHSEHADKLQAGEDMGFIATISCGVRMRAKESLEYGPEIDVAFRLLQGLAKYADHETVTPGLDQSAKRKRSEARGLTVNPKDYKASPSDAAFDAMTVALDLIREVMPSLPEITAATLLARPSQGGKKTINIQTSDDSPSLCLRGLKVETMQTEYKDPHALVLRESVIDKLQAMVEEQGAGQWLLDAMIDLGVELAYDPQPAKASKGLSEAAVAAEEAKQDAMFEARQGNNERRAKAKAARAAKAAAKLAKEADALVANA
jgi:hypothetical protein